MDEKQALWPIGELARRVAAALAVGYDGPGNARVRGVPDVRSIRWYASIGLLDKPAGFRGRTALYGPRHLRQLVAVKRRQAAGAPLSRIQAELAGASPVELERLARVPAELLDGPAESGDPATAGAAHGTTAGPATDGGVTAVVEPATATSAAAPTSEVDGRGSAVAADGPSTATPTGEPLDDPGSAETSAETTFWKTAPVSVAVTATARHPDPAPANLSYGLKLAEGLTLLVDAARCPTREDHEAVLAAAQPLLRALKARGLHTTAYTGVSP